VDDDARILKAVSRTLEPDFDVVATVTDGRKALQAVPFSTPMPSFSTSRCGLTGFQTAEELKRLETRAKIVFLTMHQDDDFVSNAIRCGAMGYVLKTLASSELTPALLHALAGRRYLPSLTPMVMTDADTHAVQFCEDDGSGWSRRGRAERSIEATPSRPS
jgi:DNA-binding NarL/FixJ family response regulator